MSAARRSVTVRIRGRSYSIAGLSPVRARSLAEKVDEAMAAAIESAEGAPLYDQAVLAALLIADELAEERESHAGLLSHVKSSVSRVLEGVDSGIAEFAPDGRDPVAEE